MPHKNCVFKTTLKSYYDVNKKILKNISKNIFRYINIYVYVWTRVFEKIYIVLKYEWYEKSWIQLIKIN